MTRSRRRGSALLIVMGMFAFMIVSAVSFSVYMRSSRTPSSYARRNAFGRQIVRAALARAMDEVDTAVGNDPFPGFGKNHIDSKNFGNVLDTHNDDWVGRVFTPSNECSFSTTVPTLTLEGLGYLPPAIINEVRYGSRHTRTAQWRSFSYGLGRYAYTAVNVSDFLDLSEFEDGVNMNRSSAANSRVTPAYLFSKAAKTQSDGDRFNNIDNSDLSKFCAAIDPQQLNNVPLVSMLDYNLWFGKNTGALLEYPFYRSISGGYSDSATFAYQDKQKVMPQLFIAGGWNGKEADASSGSTTLNTHIALENPMQQPFYGWSGFPNNKMNLEAVFNDEMWRNSQNAVNLDHCSGSSRNVPNKLGEVLPAITQCLLYDYLDYDSTPLSLALPCTEMAPMLVYANLDNCVRWQTVVDEVERTEPATDTEPAKKFVKKTYKLQLKIEGMVNLGTVYPFLNKPLDGKTFNLDCFMRVFLTEGTGSAWDNGLRDTGGGLKLETGNVGSGDFRWGNINDKVRQPAYLQVKSGQVSVNAAGYDNAANAVALVDPLAFDWTTDIVLAEIEYEMNEDGSLKPPVAGAAKSGKELGSEFSVLANDWAVTSVTDSADPFDETKGTTGTTKYYPSAAIWVRIRNSDDEVVDLVPATLSYDNLDGKRTASSDDMLRDASGSQPGTGTPLLRYFPVKEANSEIEFNGKFFVDNKGTVKDVKWDLPTYTANDPRYNWAPEDWCANSATDPKADGWLNRVLDFQKNHKEWCDTDIFMQVSNQGYLQSMYELMMVPQVSPIGSFGTMDIFLGRLLERRSVRPYNGARRTATDLTGAVNNELMWRTYKSDAFLYNTDRKSVTGYKDSSLWKEWGTIEDFRFLESTTGMRVNPYTDITNLFAGAIANMPNSWWAAGTNWNDTTGLKKYMDPTSSDARKLNEEYLLDCTISYKDVADMSRFMMREFRHNPTEANIVNTNSWLGWSKVMDVWNWLMPDGERFDEWNFAGTDNDMDTLMADLLSVERKFMYGYLKGCFANTKQLFLMFVRAEPSDGGGGGRAVALVWRDPDSQFSDDNSDLYLQREDPIFAEETWRLKNRRVPPHKMRVLFYHQFD